MDKEITWSFSRIDYSCLSAWYYNYVLKKKQEDNAWGIAGNLLHSIMEKLSNGEINESDALELFDAMWWDFEPQFEPFMGHNMQQKYYEKIRPFFERKIILIGETKNTEEKLEFALPSGEMFQGYVDREIEGEIQDYKIANPKSPAWNTAKKIRQLYLYAYGIHQTRGYYPKRLRFIFFQHQNKDIVVDFNEASMEQTIEWAEKQIKRLRGLVNGSEMGYKGLFMPPHGEWREISKEKKQWVRTEPRDMMCEKICGYRNSCQFIKNGSFVSPVLPITQEVELKS